MITLVGRKLTKKRFHPYLTENEFIGIPRGKQESFKNTVQQIEWDNIIRGTDSEKVRKTPKYSQKPLKKLSRNLAPKLSINNKCKNK